MSVETSKLGFVQTVVIGVHTAHKRTYDTMCKPEKIAIKTHCYLRSPVKLKADKKLSCQVFPIIVFIHP